MAGLVLGYDEGHSSAPADPVSGDLLDAARNVPQAGNDNVTASVHRAGCGGGCGVEGLDLRLQDWSKRSEKKSEEQEETSLWGRELTSNPGVSGRELSPDDRPIRLRHLQLSSEALRPNGLLGIILPSFILLAEKLADEFLDVFGDTSVTPHFLRACINPK